MVEQSIRLQQTVKYQCCFHLTMMTRKKVLILGLGNIYDMDQYCAMRLHNVLDSGHCYVVMWHMFVVFSWSVKAALQ